MNGEECLKGISRCYLYGDYQKPTDYDTSCELHLPMFSGDRIECPFLSKENPVTDEQNGRQITNPNRWKCTRGEETTRELERIYENLEDQLCRK